MLAAHPFVLFVLIGRFFLSMGSLVAQAPNEFDFDTTQLAITNIPPNGATHAIATSTTYTGQNLALNAPLVVRTGAELRLVRSVLNIYGNVTLEEGGRITVIDSSLLLPCQYQQQYEFRIEGGLVHTERAVIGGAYVGNILQPTRFLHLRGTWLARQTIVQALVPVLSYGRLGWFGDPRFKGGSVFADGLYEGDRADGVHMSGLGDATLANGTMNVAFYYDAGTSPVPVATTLNLDRHSQLSIVYGDPSVHAGVTVPISSHPNRFELDNHRVPLWFLFAVEASSTGPLHSITLRNAEDITCSFAGTDLIGSPVLGGPWGNHYSTLPGLPSTARPGHHALPPGCSVRLGNVVFQSGSGVNDWNRIRFWGLYTEGLGTNLTVTGPTMFAELQMRDGGQMHLIGTNSFDMGVLCETVRLHEAASLHLTNVSLGAFNTGGTSTGIIEANDSSSCTITNARSAPLRLRTTNAAAGIAVQNLFGRQNLILDSTAGGAIQVLQAPPSQSWDLQNLGFESALSAGVPQYWLAQSVTGSLVADAAPGASGTNAYALVVQAPTAWLQKQLTLPTETFVSFIGAAKVVQAPTGGAQLMLQAGNGAAFVSKAANLLQLNTWQRVHVPVLTVGSAASPTLVQFVASGFPATVRLDDFRVQLGSWWENDNLANLGFEWGYRFQGEMPTYWSAPDSWSSYQTTCVSEAAVIRPGALAGSRSVLLTLQAGGGSVYKDMTFLRAGDTAVVRGWARGIAVNPGAAMQAIVGDGYDFYLVGVGPNQHTPPLPCDGIWRQFQLTYVVPTNPTFTRLYLGCYDTAGAQCWWDDITVDIQ